GFVTVGCSAGLAPTALPILSFDIRSSFNGRSIDRSLNNGSQLAVAAPLHLVLDLRGQGGEIALAAVIDNNDEPM
ncbi:MAG: hypothetical protein WA170_04465, partial [Candidatus Acidiferrales bacterium]